MAPELSFAAVAPPPFTVEQVVSLIGAAGESSVHRAAKQFGLPIGAVVEPWRRAVAHGLIRPSRVCAASGDMLFIRTDPVAAAADGLPATG